MSERPSAWKVKRLVRARDGFRCVRCGQSHEECRRIWRRGLHVHRLVAGSDYTVGGCVSLCKRCHILTHGGSDPKHHKNSAAYMPPENYPANAE